MVLSLITLAATVPMLATSTIQLQDQWQRTQEDAELEVKTEKCHLGVRATKRMNPDRQDEFQNMRVVLHQGYLLLESGAVSERHPFTGYLLPYPETSYDGIVSTINDDNMLNWIYLDRDSHQLRYGVRSKAQHQWTGPMKLVSDQVSNEWRVAFDGWEGFVAVQEDDKSWALYFDKNDDGLVDKAQGKPIIEVELVRTPLEEARKDDDPD